MRQTLTRIDFYTDGACPGNGKIRGGAPMGAGIVATSGQHQKEWGIFLGPGTNQKAELHAIREALLKVKDRSASAVRIFTDSAYAIGCLTRGWKVKENVELVQEVRRLVAECGEFRMEKVAGHAGVPANERADELATRAALTGEHFTSGQP